MAEWEGGAELPAGLGAESNEQVFSRPEAAAPWDVTVTFGFSSQELTAVSLPLPPLLLAPFLPPLLLPLLSTELALSSLLLFIILTFCPLQQNQK